jgi:hypothetical protein
MDRIAFRKTFKSLGPAVLPVIHVLDEEQAHRNVRVAMDEGAAGVFLINHDFPREQLLPIVRRTRQRFPALWMGVNFLAVTGREAFPILGRLEAEGTLVDAYWADDACIDERRPAHDQVEAEAIRAARLASGWSGLYLGGVCFKKQRPVPAGLTAAAAGLAAPFMDAVCTSGVATGEAADFDKIRVFRDAVGEAPLALASGITPDNAGSYAADVDAFLVATGINRPGDFYNIDPQRLRLLLSITRSQGHRP